MNICRQVPTECCHGSDMAFYYVVTTARVEQFLISVLIHNTLLISLGTSLAVNITYCAAANDNVPDWPLSSPLNVKLWHALFSQLLNMIITLMVSCKAVAQPVQPVM